MSERADKESSPKESKPHHAASANSLPRGEANIPTASNQEAPDKLSAEENWELFEKELKESDWGHQPC